MQPDFARQEPAVGGRITSRQDHRSRDEPGADAAFNDILVPAPLDAAHAIRNVREPRPLEGLSRDLVDVRAVRAARDKTLGIGSRT
jgi:hypothetical protein